MKQLDSSGKDSGSYDNAKVCLIYDHACPICRHVAEKYEVTNSNLEIISARESGAHVDRAIRMGVDINRGIIVVDEGEYFFAEDAIQQLAKKQKLQGFLGVLVPRLFRHAFFVKLLYPPLTVCRKILLKILGISLIQKNEGEQDGIKQPDLSQQDVVKKTNVNTSTLSREV